MADKELEGRLEAGTSDKNIPEMPVWHLWCRLLSLYTIHLAVMGIVIWKVSNDAYWSNNRSEHKLPMD